MAVRQDKVQISIEFLTDESKRFAKTLLDTKEFNRQIDTSNKELAKLQKELVKAGDKEAARLPVLAKIAAEEQKILTAQRGIADAAAKTAKIDLTRLTPAQLVERARQLSAAMRDIPASAPAFQRLQDELAGVNTRLRQMKQEAQGIQDQGQKQGGAAGGGIFGSIAGRVVGFVAVIGAAFAAVQGVFRFVGQAIQAFDVGAKADAALKSRIESTAGAAGRSLEQLTAQAEALAKVTLFDDDQTKKGQELLLTFTNIRGEVFDETIPVLQDLSTVLGQDISTSAIQVGKALNDPVKGLTALQRAGVTFSDEQKKLIARLVETGDVAGAQKVILAELGKEFGGAAKAAAAAGLGPFAVLQNRMGELKESLGELASRGLKTVQPFLEKLVTFFEGLTDALVDGKEATGQYSGAISATVGVLKFLGDVIGAAWRWQVLLFESFVEGGKALYDFVQASRQLPLIGTAINAVVVVVQVLRDALGNVSATWQGVVASVQQGASNVADFFTGLVLKAQVFAKELDLALSIRQGTKDRLTKELGDLKAQQEAAKAGKSIGDAYTQARNAAIAGQQQVTGRDAAENARNERQGGNTATRRAAQTGLSVGGTDVEDAKKRIKDRLDNELKAVEAAALRREVVLEKFRLDGTIGEERYQDGLLGIQQRKYLEQLEVYRRFKQEQTVEGLKVQKQLLEIEQRTTVRTTFVQEVAALPGRTPAVPTSTADNTEQRLAVQDIGEEALQAALRSKFEAALITEQDYELQRLELKRLALAEEIAILQSASQPQVEEIRKREEEKAKVEDDIRKTRDENEARSAAFRQQVAQASIQATADVFAVAAELLAQDDAARKKNASTIKAFQTAQVIVQGIAEVQKIWAGAAALGPIAGPIVGAIQTAVAVGRTVVAVNKIQSTKFERGGPVRFKWLPGAVSHSIEEAGAAKMQVLRPMQRASAKMGFFGGKRHSAGGTKGVFDDGTRIEVERDEAFVVVNRRNAPLLRALSAVNAHNGNGVPFFARGGVVKFEGGGSVSLNTNPLPLPSAQSSQQQSVQQLDRLSEVVMDFQQVVAAFPRTVRSQVVYQDVEDAGTLLNEVRDDAAI